MAKNKIKEYNEASGVFGHLGHELIEAAGSSSANKVFCRMHSIGVTDIDYTDSVTGADITGLQIPSDFEIVGKLTDITVNSGSVLAYIGENTV